MMMNSVASSSLCPGYKQVDAFGPDEDYEGEEEVIYVTLDLGNIEPTLVPSSSTYRLIGLDTPTPFLQLSGTILKGRHTALLGTELLFTDSKDRNKRSVVHVANTEQRICFKEVRLQPKGTEPPPSAKWKGKGKTQDVEVEDVIDSAPQLGEASQTVDRVTGKSAPRTRAPRTKKAKQSGTTRQTKSRKAKGKAKAVEETPPGEGGGSEGEDGMDMDVDEG